MFGITGFKLIIILIAGLILIGPERMPEIARTIGKALRMFNEAKDEMQQMLRADMLSGDSKSAVPPRTETTVASTLYTDDEDEEEEEE